MSSVLLAELQKLVSAHGYWVVALIVGLESMGLPGVVANDRAECGDRNHHPNVEAGFCRGINGKCPLMVSSATPVVDEQHGLGLMQAQTTLDFLCGAFQPMSKYRPTGSRLCQLSLRSPSIIAMRQPLRLIAGAIMPVGVKQSKIDGL